MSTVAMLRSAREVLSLGGERPGAFTVRVQMPEAYDTVAVRCASDLPVIALKQGALDHFEIRGHAADEFVLKLRGFEVLDEQESLSDAGAREGSTFLLAYRRRRPVR